jgi:hypothetical protein
MIDPDGSDAEQSAAPELREQISAARDRVSELLLVVVGISGGLGMATNLLVSWIHDGSLSQPEWIALFVAVTLTLALALAATLRLRVSSRELDEEIELALPLLVPTGAATSAIEVVEVSAYNSVTDLAHAAVARLPSEQNAALAQAARRIDRGPSQGTAMLTVVPSPAHGDDESDDDEVPSSISPSTASDDPVLWFLQLTQVLVAAECLDESERLLGSQALFHRGRWLRRRTPRLHSVTWSELIATAGAARPFLSQRDLPGIRQRSTIPAAARLVLPDVADELGAAKRRATSRKQSGDRSEEGLLIPLLAIDAGRAGWLTINGVGRISAHGVPRFAQPAAGLTTRAFLRNARDNDLRRRALEEEALATLRVEGGVPRPGARPPAIDLSQALAGGAEGLTAAHARVWRALYRGTRRPRVARVYLTVQGRFRVRLSGRGSIADQALYAWSAALARRVGWLDIDVFMARLAARQQIVPMRRL